MPQGRIKIKDNVLSSSCVNDTLKSVHEKTKLGTGGTCDIFALALHEALGAGEIHLWTDAEEGDEWTHAAVKLDNVFLDADGVQSEQEITARWEKEKTIDAPYHLVPIDREEFWEYVPPECGYSHRYPSLVREFKRRLPSCLIRNP